MLGMTCLISFCTVVKSVNKSAAFNPVCKRVLLIFFLLSSSMWKSLTNQSFGNIMPSG